MKIRPRGVSRFTRFCQFTWVVAGSVGPVPLIFDNKAEIYKNNGIDFTALKHLDAIGLISFESVSGYQMTAQGKYSYIFYFGRPMLLEHKNEQNNELKLGQALFTQAGRELVSVCGAKRNQEFYEYAIQKLADQGATLSCLLPNH